METRYYISNKPEHPFYSYDLATIFEKMLPDISNYLYGHIFLQIPLKFKNPLKNSPSYLVEVGFW